MKPLRFALRSALAAALLGALALGVGTARAGGSATLSLAVFPGTLAPGGSGAVAATFVNNGPSTLTHVIVNVTLPVGATFDAADSSAACAGTAPTIACSLGNLHNGVTVISTIAFDNAPASGPVEFDGSATWDAASVGKPHGAAASNDTASGTATADVLPPGGSASSNCLPHGSTLSATAEDGRGTEVTAGDNTLGLSCTPILTGVDTSDVSFVKLPTLQTPATVVLTFPDETLPWPSEPNVTPPPESRDAEAPAELVEYPHYPSLASPVNVPGCVAGAIPSGFDACIVSIQSNDEGELESQDNDADLGTITLLVQGSSTGDPGFTG
jgi:Domain of unknown function DUF11